MQSSSNSLCTVESIETENLTYDNIEVQSRIMIFALSRGVVKPPYF